MSDQSAEPRARLRATAVASGTYVNKRRAYRTFSGGVGEQIARAETALAAADAMLQAWVEFFADVSGMPDDMRALIAAMISTG